MKVFSFSAALMLVSGTALAADLPVYQPPVEPAPMAAPAPAFDWSGVYLGAHGGYGWGEADIDGVGTVEVEGGLVGGQIGANWQWNMLVLGIEGDASWSWVDGSEAFGGTTVDIEADWLASARGRVGLGFDRFLVYGTGGAAWAGVDVSATGGLVGSDENTHFGWVYGGGAEVMMTQNISFGVEYLHYDFDEEDYTIGGPTFSGDGDLDVVRGRVNFKFSSLYGG